MCIVTASKRKKKVSRSIAVIHKAKQLLDHNSLRTLYCSLVLPYLHYCAEVWGNTYKTSLQSLITLQKRAIRTIHKVNHLEHTNPLFIQPVSWCLDCLVHDSPPVAVQEEQQANNEDSGSYVSTLIQQAREQQAVNQKLELGMHDIIGTLSLSANICLKINYPTSAISPISADN